ncbi:MAG: pilus assembly PilX N-terminal domain-containing protein [Dethiobacter sp.]|nr:pilus assembly PilX N-terminal domain-containing protein [Dethiobacter sp.]MBS3901989.1 pilus assembly PilX N-terminal domain-containing protein [Dethiobacter sp.]MBS3988375.1 pilus assembly PilX N-terminal domain-containing protein [Dethiobacter sp.]
MFTKNEKGLALPLVLLIMLTVSLLGVTVWQYSVTDTIHVALDADRMQAHYLARSGADALAEFIVRNPSRATEMIAKTATNKATGALGNDKNFKVNVTGDPTSLITITAEGISGKATETLILDLTPLTASEIFNNAIFSKADLDVTKMKSVTGDLESVGNISAPGGYGYRVARNSARVFSSPLIPSLLADPNGADISIANNETRTITGNFAYGTIEMAPNATLVFDNGGGVQQVVVRSLTTKGDISVVGAGRLELFITGSADFQTPLVVNHTNPNNLFVFLADNTTLTVQANGQINAFIYGPNADVRIQSGNSIINGAIIANLIVKNHAGGASNGSVNFRQIDHGIRPLTAIAGFRRSVWREGR